MYFFYYDQTPACNLTYSYSLTVDGVTSPTLAWLTAATSTTLLYPQISISTSDTTFAGPKAITLTTSLNDGTFSFSDSIAFTFDFLNPCLTSAWNTVNINNMVTSVLVSPSLAPQIYTSFSLTTAVACGSVTYGITPSLSFVTLDGTTRSINVVSSSQADADSYSMTLTGKLTNYPSISLALPFQVTINPCVLTSVFLATTSFGFT